MDLRTEMVMAMQSVGIEIETSHHEVATAGQCEIDMKFNPLLLMADQLMWFKYCVKNVAKRAGKSATFMPKPLYGDNGSGMHCHQSIWKEGKPLFAGDGYAGMSEMALHYVGGILKHAKSLAALTNPTTNSYRRLGSGLRSAGQSSRTRAAIARRRFASRCSARPPRRSGSKSVSPTRAATRTSPSQRCSWPVSTACRTRSTRVIRWKKTSIRSRPKS